MAEAVLRQAVFHDMSALGRDMQGEMRRSGVPAVHAGFREACRELRGEGDPREARRSNKIPTVIEFDIDPEDLVYPMIQPGGTLKDMIMDC